MKTRWIVAIALAACADVALATGFDFAAPQSRTIGSKPASVVVGDVNGDGLDDAVVVTSGYYYDPPNDNKIVIFLQRADGALAAPLKYPYGTYPTGGRVQVGLGDLNKDGVQDIVACHHEGLTLVLGNSANTFAPQAVFAYECASVGLLDVNLDGNPDIVGQSQGAGATVFYGNGKGGISSTEHIDTGAGDELAAGDVTGDGVPDLAVISGSYLVVYPHNAGPGLGTPQQYRLPDGASMAGGIAIGDFNHHGRNEVAVSVWGSTPASAVWVYQQNGAGALAAPYRVASDGNPGAMVAQDLDHDGRQDLLEGHVGSYAIGRFLQSSTGVLSEALTPVTYNRNYQALAAGDLNDDGCSDAAISEWNASPFGGLITLLGTNCSPVRASSDFNGDGRSDILWRASDTGADAIWLSSNSGTPRTIANVPNQAWKVAGHGDFNGDGRADVLWRNSSTGVNAIWLSGNASTQQGIAAIGDLAWKVAGVGDFNGDGKADILWRNSTTGANGIWLAGSSATQQPTTGVTNLTWTIVGVGDFDGDRKDDILWRDAGAGANVIWHSGRYGTAQTMTPVTNVQWKVAGIGDFDGDGKADILWRNSSTGQNSIWRSAVSATPIYVSAVALDWDVAAVGDYTGNRKADVFWRNRKSGANVIWRGAKKAVPLPVTLVANPAWKVVP